MTDWAAAQLIPISSLLASDSPRLAGEDAMHIQMLAQSEMPLPPILVHRDTMRVIDGMHRFRVALMKGQDTIEVQFFDGSKDEAFVRAVRSNTEHGLPLTLADRRAAATRIIASHPHWSDRRIAVTTGLASATVASIRSTSSSGDGERAVRIGKDGRARPLGYADGRRLAAAAITQHPEASLREIAKLARISPATVRDVRERLRRGEDPVPPRQSAVSRRASASGGGLRPGAHQGHVPRAAAKDRAALLQSLRQDPSLRLSEAGRDLLRWLDVLARCLGPWQKLVDSAPPHCAYLLAELAHSYAGEWLDIASRLEQRNQDGYSAPGLEK
jgi:ParB-like chromosome segregation protein Spo0J